MSLESELDKLTIPDEENSGPINTNRKDCSYCKKPFTVELWCKKCDPFRMIEGWTSGNPHIDKFIKDTIYDARKSGQEPPRLLEWVPFDRFTDVKQIGEGGFAKVYTATWIDGKPEFEELDDGSWRKGRRKPMKKIALKRLNGSQNMSVEFLNELQIFWKYAINCNTLDFYGITKDEEFIMIVDYANEGNYRSILSTRFNNILWRDKIDTLYSTSFGLRKFHKMGFCHKDFHSGNILQHDNASFISDFGLSRPASEQDSSGKIYGVLPYIAPEVLNGEPYTEASDIYSFGIFMAELSSGNPPFYNSRHDLSLALSICEGLRPEFGKGTPEFYKKLAYRCMNAIPSQRPTADELSKIFDFWGNALRPKAYIGVEKKFGYNRREVKMAFDQADKEIPNISPSYDPNAIYTSRAFTFNNLSKPVNSSLIKSYIEDNKDSQDSKLMDLEL